MQITERESQKGTQISQAHFREACVYRMAYIIRRTRSKFTRGLRGLFNGYLENNRCNSAKLRNHLKCSKKGIDSGF